MEEHTHLHIVLVLADTAQSESSAYIQMLRVHSYPQRSVVLP